MKYCIVFGFSFLIMGCTTTDHLDKKPYFDTQKLYCAADQVEFCQGRNRKMMTCHCVDKSRLSFDSLYGIMPN